MIEFKTVCKNFTLLLENAKKSPRNLFLNSSLELVDNPDQEASFEEVLSALQSRSWSLSDETPEEIDENIKKIWQQTVYFYQGNPSCNVTGLQELYQTSIFQGLLTNPSKAKEYAAKIHAQCEVLCRQRCLYQSKKILSNPPEDLIQPLLQTFEEQIEQNYRQILALQGTDEFQLLKEWSQNQLPQFLSVFIEEQDGKIETSFPDLFKLFLLTQDATVSKKKPKKNTHSHKQTTKEMHPKELREKLLKIIARAPAVEISTLEKVKFLSLKNAMNPKNSGFRNFWKALKQIHSTFDSIESDKRAFLQSQENFSQGCRKIVKKVGNLQNKEHLHPQLHTVMDSFEQAKKDKTKAIKERSLAHFKIKESIKTHFFEEELPDSTLFPEIVLIKMKNSSFFDRTVESSFLRSYVKNSAASFLTIENDEILYRNLLRELEKIQSTIPTVEEETLYKVSEETQDLFDAMGMSREKIFSMEEFIAPEIPILQPVFNKAEVAKVDEFLQDITLQEKFFWEEMMKNLLAHKLELQLEEKESIAQLSKPAPLEKNKRSKAIKQKKRLSSQATTAIQVTAQNWQKIIPVHTHTKVDLLYPTHVTRWFDNPTNSLKDPKYICLIKDIGKEECLYFHSFPKIIDKFVGTNYSLQNEVFNERTGQRDILYGIAGEFEIKGRKYRGFFQYIIDSKSGTCYHRCFNFRNKNFIEDLVEEKIWYPNDFPSLDQSKNYTGKEIESFVFDNITLQYDSILQKIYVETEKMKIVLFSHFDSDLMHEMFTLLDK